MFITDVDVNHECPVSHVLNIFDEHKASIHSFKAIGPGGGNPNFVLGFETKDQAKTFLDHWYKDQGFYSDELWNMIKEI